jgi:hypothetical protein
MKPTKLLKHMNPLKLLKLLKPLKHYNSSV